MGGGPGDLLQETFSSEEGRKQNVDNATKRQLKKQDQFLTLTNESIGWASAHRQKAIVWGAIAVAAILAIVGGYTLFESRAAAAEAAFGEAMQTYQTPLVNAAQPVPPGMKSFPDATTRAVAATAQFQQVANRYGLAEYFVGLTAMEANKPGPAEEALKKVAGSWGDADLAASAKLALAGLYQQTGRDAQAVDLYNQLAKGHSDTVSPFLAQIQLAELYQSEGKTEQARKIYAEVKDKDKDPKGKAGAAGQIAADKLNPAPVAGSGVSLGAQ